MKVLLTGAAGSLGSVALTHLRQAGHTVISTDRRMSRRADPSIEIADLCDVEAVYRLTQGVDVVVHVGNVPSDDPGFEQSYTNNVVSNMNVFQAAADRRVRRVIWASTIQVCSGLGPDEMPLAKLAYLPADGDLPAIPQNHYALGKHHSELALEAICRWSGLEGAAIRYPGLLRLEWYRKGYRPQSKKPCGKTLDAMLWLTVEDAARLLVHCVEVEKLPGCRVYLPSAEDIRVDETLDNIVAEFFPGVPWKKPLARHGSLIDNSRITAETGWRPLDTRQTVQDAANKAGK
ncbi:MAG: NAD(P)-dependent oxidoreductase [Phycisphaeraceae bacterium]